MLVRLRSAALSLGMLVAVTASHAGLITFEGHAGFAGATGNFLDVDGYRFTLTRIASGFAVITNQADLVETNQTKLFVANHATITMTRVDGGLFDLNAFDVGGSWANPNLFNRWADQVIASSGMASDTATLLGQPATYLHRTPGWLGVSSVTFTPMGSRGENDFEFTLDNISVNAAHAVPAPASLGLAGVALLGLVASRRRRA